MGLAGLGSGQATLGSAWDGVGLFRLDLIGLSELYGYGQGSIYLVLLGPCSLPVQLGLSELLLVKISLFLWLDCACICA
jgi:hypothetical protein